MFWDRSQIAIVSAFDKEYILYCVNLAFGHDPKTSFVEVPEILFGHNPIWSFGIDPENISKLLWGTIPKLSSRTFQTNFGHDPHFRFVSILWSFQISFGQDPNTISSVCSFNFTN